MGADAPKKAKLRFLANPGGLVMPIIATALGMIKAPPMPDMARMTLKAMKLLQNPHTRVNTMRNRLPSSSMFLCPYTAPKRPLTRTNVPWVRLYCRYIFLATRYYWIRTFNRYGAITYG